MPNDAGHPRGKRQAITKILSAVILLAPMMALGLYQLGRPLPQEDASSPLAWGDRVERRIDTFVDGVRPKWADHVEARLDKFADRIGWK